MGGLDKLTTYETLQKHYEQMSSVQLRDLFKADSSRFDKFSFEFNDILFDFSKNLITEETITLFSKLTEEAELKQKIELMYKGDNLNLTEKRPVLHVALRNRSNKPIFAEEKDVMPDVNRVLNQMKDFVNDIHSKKRLGYTGRPITQIVNIGIGGSDLGPAMVCDALKPFAKADMSVYFVSNVDATHIADTLKKVNPETVLFIIASKTFTTQETLRNANTAKKWFLKNTSNNEEAVAKHFIAISTNEESVRNFGIDPQNMFAFWNWVGGRYSLWSAIGISIALYLGFENFERLLTGAHKMDLHFRNTPFSKNIPVIMAMLGIWYSNFYNCKTHAVIPYEQYLCRFPEFLQQLDMESNGKRINCAGETFQYSTGPVLWGSAGTNAQHSFFQLIHQGTQMIPVDFLAGVKSFNDIEDHHKMLLSNFFAQTEALMLGRKEYDVKAELSASGLVEEDINKIFQHKVFQGNKPTNSILYKELNPETLGSLIALYEHKVFVQGILWDINSFDQWGVELGKKLAGKILPELSGNEEIINHDSSTNGLINFYKNKR